MFSTTSTWARSFGLLGSLMIGMGGLLALGPRFSGELAWLANRLASLGIESGMLFGSGMVCSGLAMLSQQIHRIGFQMRGSEEAMNCTEALRQDLQRLVERTSSLHASLHQLRESQGVGLRLLQEQTRNQSVGQQVDATYHLAASMDQLGRRLDERLNQQEQAVQQHFGSLGQALSENKADVRNMLEETRSYRREDILQQPLGDDHGLDLESEPLLQEEHELSQSDLDLRVELEQWEDDRELHEQTQSEGKIDVSAFNWNEVEIPEAHKHRGLGLSSAEDQSEALSAPLPSSGSSNLEWEGPDSKPRGAKLGVLDELGEDGTAVDARASADAQLADLPGIAPKGRRPIEELNEPELFTKEDLDEAWKAFRRGERE